ncbi:MAG: secretin and TonB N-terminal domain-containing protein, partial [Fermentimonas sp.]|nr:secretin and TonB N-terminal domain-containing protein [Fermentimonas sp.]
MKSKLLLLPLLLWMFAITANPQVTVNVTNKSVRETLKEIERKSEYKFFFNESLAGLEKKTNLNVNDAEIAKVMSMLLAGTGIDYRIEEDNLIVLVTKSVPATRLTASQQTNRTITGTITDPSGEPIIGAT